MSLIKADSVAPLLDRFLGYFCVSLKKLRLTVEKQQAFRYLQSFKSLVLKSSRGLFFAIAKNPNGIVNNFMYLCEALVNLGNLDADLQDLATKLIVNFKAIAGDFWSNYFNSFPPELQQQMRQKYGV